MKAPLFSVIIPAHNEETYIGQTIMSIYNQTITDPIEIIVVNDNSTDHTAEIVKHKIHEMPKLNIKLIDVKKGSAAGARNAGVNAAKGKYIIFQDADCFADPTLLNNAAKLLEDYPIDGVATRTTNTEPKNWIQRAVATQRDARWENNISRPMMIDKDSGINVAIMKRTVFKKLGGFNENIFYFEDNDLTRRFFESGFSAIFGGDWVVQYHNDPLTLQESIGQCRSIVKGMKKRDKISYGEAITLLSVPANILTGLPALCVWAYYSLKTKDVVGAFYFSCLWSIRSAAKLWYCLFL